MNSRSKKAQPSIKKGFNGVLTIVHANCISIRLPSPESMTSAKGAVVAEAFIATAVESIVRVVL